MKKFIRMWVMPNAGFATQPILETQLRLFYKHNPDIEVDTQVISWSKAWQRLMRATKRGVSSDEMPDVVQIGSTWQATLTHMGGLMELSNLLPTELIDDTIEPLLESCRSADGEEIYAVPWFSDVRVLYYRKDLLKKAGISLEEISDWKGFQSVLRKLKEFKWNDFSPMSMPGQSEHVLMHDLAPWVWCNHSDFFDPTFKKSMLHESSFLEAAQFYFQLIDSGVIPLMGQGRMTYGNFFTGSSAFQVSGAWPATTLLNPKNHDCNKTVAHNYGVTLIPSSDTDKKRIGFIGGSHLAVFSGSRNREEAWKLIQFLTTKIHQESHAKMVGALPARKSSFSQAFFGTAWQSVGSCFYEAVQSARTFPSLTALGTIEQVILSWTDQIMDLLRTKRFTHAQLAELSRESSTEIDHILSLYK